MAEVLLEEGPNGHTGALRTGRRLRVWHVVRGPYGMNAAMALGVFCAALLMRLATAAQEPTEWDSAQLALGVDRFDVTEHSPHPPGYYLYVLAARLLRASTGMDAHRCMVVIAAIVMAAGISVAYLAGQAFGGRRLGVPIALFLLTSPYTWFYGSIANSYGSDVFLSSVLLFLGLKARPRSWHGWAAAAVLGVAGGFRPSSMVLFAPLALVAVLRSTRSFRGLVAVGAAGAIAVVMWAIPMVLEQPGGLSSWWAATARLWGDSSASTALSRHGQDFGKNFRRTNAETVVALGPLLVVGAIGWTFTLIGAIRQRFRSPLRVFNGPALLLLAGVPAFASSALMYFGKSGYVLNWLIPFAILLCLPLTRFRGFPTVVLTAIVVFGATFNVSRYLFAPGILPGRYVGALPLVGNPQSLAPYPLTRAEIKKADAVTRRYRQFRTRLDPQRDVLVWVLGNGGEWYRHGTYALPSFTADLLWGDSVAMRARAGRWSGVHLARIEVPLGGRAVFIVAQPPPGSAPSGSSNSVPLGLGNLVVQEPGPTPFGVEVAAVPNPFRPGRDGSNWP